MFSFCNDSQYTVDLIKLAVQSDACATGDDDGSGGSGDTGSVAVSSFAVVALCAIVVVASTYQI